jgi:hypothetical protein
MCCLLAKYSSDNSHSSDTESCFDTDIEGETDSNTNLTNVDTNVEGENKGELDISWIINKDKDRSPEYYLNQEEEFDEAEDVNEDYKDNSIVLLDRIEE